MKAQAKEQPVWELYGKVIEPTGQPFNLTHCMLPTPILRENGVLDLYYGGRNADNQSYICTATIDLTNPSCVWYGEEPVLSPGKLGTFSDNGVLPSCFVDKKLYYIGFKPGGTTRMQLLTGSATLTEGEYIPDSHQPFLSSHIGIATAPCMVSGHLYYVHGLEWVDKDTPRYDIRVVRKTDEGFDIKCAIPLEDGENALARPWVVKDGDTWRMWFSAKGDTYRPQYAESSDGTQWVRKPYDFPEEEMAYAVTVEYDGKTYMFYNKGYGEDGIYMAVK